LGLPKLKVMAGQKQNIELLWNIDILLFYRQLINIHLIFRHLAKRQLVYRHLTNRHLVWKDLDANIWKRDIWLTDIWSTVTLF
jgi:hypothetical protein